MTVKRAIIGGSGLYEIEGATIIEEKDMDTPWGKPSDVITIAEVNGIQAAFLPRHGRGHKILPTEVNNRANIAALKMLGVEEIFAFSAVGSLKEEIAPEHFVLPSQVIDRTRQRENTFYGNGVVGHVSFADPFCPKLQAIVEPLVKELNITMHTDETLVCMEGPAFSTRAESHMYRSWGAGIINMSTLPEAKLAKEAEICYAVICMSTDYDCWKEDEEHVTIDMVIETSKKNSAKAKKLIEKIITSQGSKVECGCHEAAKYAIMTSPDVIPSETLEKLKVLYPEYYK
jgi:5'-methylthioadenosine phosphorylase